MEPSVASHLNYQSLQDAGAPSAPSYAFGIGDAYNMGISPFAMDDFNQAVQNQYNNAYNYWLWQKQAEYDSPKNQVARLKEAGLNPNFNSIEGTGNLGSMPSSQGSMPGRIQSNRLNAIGTAVQMATGIAGTVAKGVQAFKTFATTPSSVKYYRGLLSRMLGERFSGTILDNILKDYRGKQLGVFTGLGTIDGGEDNIRSSLWYRSLDIQLQMAEKKLQYQNLLNEIKEWEKDSYNPQVLDNLKATWKNIVAGTALRDINLDWYNANQAIGIVRVLAPLFFRSIF